MFKFLQKKLTFKEQLLMIPSLLHQLWKLKAFKLLLGIVVFLILLPFILFFIYRPIVNPDVSYGVNFSNKYAEEMGLDWKDAYTKILDDLKAKNIRIVAYWDEIEPQKDTYDLSKIEWQVQEAKKRNVNVIVAVGRKVPRWPECFEPEWWNEIKDEQVRDFHVYKFVESVVSKLKGYDNVILWQVENEPFFPFGECEYPIKPKVLENEVSIVRAIDSRPIIIQDSGEGGYWFPSYRKGDYLAISMYRKIWFDFWGVFLKQFVYFQYPLPHWSYKLKAFVTRVPVDKIIVTELQAEPWGPGPNHIISREQKDITMSRNDFLSVISYAQRSGFKNLYFWGAEWWLWEKEKAQNPFYWETARSLFN